MGAMLIRPGIENRVYILHSIEYITPIIGVCTVQNTRLHMQFGGMFDYGDLVQRVAGVLIVVFTRVGIDPAVESDGLIVADSEGRIHGDHRLDGQVKAIPYLVAVVANTRELVLHRLASGVAVPCVRLARTHHYGGVNRVHMINGQHQATQRIATKTVGEHKVIDSRETITIAVPIKTCSFRYTNIVRHRIRHMT